MRHPLLSSPLQGYRQPRLRLGRLRPRVLAAGVAIACGLTLFVDWPVASTLLHPPPFAHPDSPAGYGLRPQAIALASPRLDRPLAGWLFEQPASRGRAVLFLHGWRSHREHMLKDYLSWLARRYTVLAFDHPGHGKSPAGPTTLGDLERTDAEAALDLLRRKGYRRVGVMGVSMGGATAIGLAAARGDVRAVVSEGAFAVPSEAAQSYFRRRGVAFPDLFAVTTTGLMAVRSGRNLFAASAERQIAHLGSRPILLIHGTDDHVVRPTSAHRLFAVAPGPKELWMVQGADHVSDPLKGPHALGPAAYEQRVLAFFERTL